MSKDYRALKKAVREGRFERLGDGVNGIVRYRIGQLPVLVRFEDCFVSALRFYPPRVVYQGPKGTVTRRGWQLRRLLGRGEPNQKFYEMVGK